LHIRTIFNGNCFGLVGEKISKNTLVIGEAGTLLQQYFYKQHAIPDFKSMYILINLTKLY